MNKTLTLTRVLWKTSIGTWLGKGSSTGKITKNEWILIVMFIAFLPLAIMFGLFVSNLYDVLASIHQEGVIPGLWLSLTSLVIFIFGIFYVITVLYFSQDVEHLLPLPLKPWQILSAKFVVTLMYEYITEAFLLLPVLITFGIKSGGGILYYIYSVAIFLVLPIIPLILASVIVMLIMRFTSVARNKSMFRLVGGSISVVIAFGANVMIQFFIRKLSNSTDLQNLFTSGNNSLLDAGVSFFPTVKLAALSLLNTTIVTGFVYLLLFLLLSALLYVGFTLLGEWLYFKGVLGASEVSAKRERVTDDQLEKLTVPKSVLKSYLLKEMRILFRTPAYFTNCVLLAFLWPVLLLIPLITQPGGLGNLKEIGKFLNNPETAGIAIAITFAVFLSISGGNSTTTTAISREGRGFFVNKHLPVPYHKMILAKALSGVLLLSITMVLMIVMIFALVHPPVSFLIMTLIVGIPAIVFGCLTGLIIDLKLPKLIWDTEQKAVKQNTNILINMLSAFILSAVIAVVTFIFRLSLPVAFFGLFGLFTVLDVLLFFLLMSKGAKWMGKIDV